MDAKTLEKMTVPKLREEARKFEDIVGVHGMNKEQLLVALKRNMAPLRKKQRVKSLPRENMLSKRRSNC